MKNARLLVLRSSPNPRNTRSSATPLPGPSLMALVASVLMLSLLVVSAVIPSAYGVASGTKPSRSTVSTDHLTVEFTFPYSADLGQSITISATSTAKSNGRIIRFSIDIFSYVDKQLVRLASRTIVTDTIVRVGDNWQTWLQVVVPTNAQRGPLMGTVTEVWQETSTYYYYTSYCSYSPQNYYRYYSQNYYPQNYPYYSTYDTCNTQQYLCSRNGITALRISPQSHTQPSYVYKPSYLCQPSYVYKPSYVCQPSYVPQTASCYSPDYATQVSSQQTFTLTYVLGCCCP